MDLYTAELATKLRHAIGSFVTVDGETCLFVAIRGKWAILENEGERPVQVPLAVLDQKLRER